MSWSCLYDTTHFIITYLCLSFPEMGKTFWKKDRSLKFLSLGSCLLRQKCKSPFSLRKDLTSPVTEWKSGSFNLACAQTTWTNRNGFMGSVYDGTDLSDIGLPGSACFAVGMGNIISKRNTLSAVHTFCHILHLPRIFGLSQINKMTSVYELL